MNKLYVCAMSLLVFSQARGMESESEEKTCSWDEAEMSLINRQEDRVYVHRAVENPTYYEEVLKSKRIEVVKVRLNILCKKHAPQQQGFGVAKFFDRNGKEVYCGTGFSDIYPMNPAQFVLGAYKLLGGYQVEYDVILPAGTIS